MIPRPLPVICNAESRRRCVEPMSIRVRPTVPRLHLITNRALCGDRGQAAIVAEAALAGVGAVQLREKDLDATALLREATSLKDVLGTTPLIINGAPDVALTVGAAGVHLPGDGGTIAAARAALGSSALIGRSVHTVDEARNAAADGADYLIVGTIFATASKPGRAPAGLPFITAVARAVAIPIVAIGGIDEGNVAATLAAGAWGVAVMSGVLSAPEPGVAVRRLRAIIEKENR
jgi:thiazole tautomerase (transcriptional regulator TenI)